MHKGFIRAQEAGLKPYFFCAVVNYNLAFADF